jgi:hypothetical protein
MVTEILLKQAGKEKNSFKSGNLFVLFHGSSICELIKSGEQNRETEIQWFFY